MNLRSLVLITFLVLWGCSTAPKDRASDAQCGKFCNRIDACLGDRYDSDLKEKLCSMARCESGCRELAQSPAGYYGTYQFGSSTWKEVCGPIFKKKGLNRCLPTSARGDLCCASECTAEMISRGMSGRWPNCG